jgi:hypothetical protein
MMINSNKVNPESHLHSNQIETVPDYDDLQQSNLHINEPVRSLL